MDLSRLTLAIKRPTFIWSYRSNPCHRYGAEILLFEHPSDGIHAYAISMIIHLGYIHELVRYPVKSMAGISTDSAFLGWHGLQGDRRFAFRRLNDNSGFPWLTASRLPELILYEPLGLDENAEEPTPTHVRTPEGMNFALGSAELQNSVAEKFGSAWIPGDSGQIL
jgi:hypothetical protein